MSFSILHISDLHRDLSDEVSNEWLLDSIEKDFDQFSLQEPPISRPSICVVSGDIIYGVSASHFEPDLEFKRQYDQAEAFLIGLANRFFNGDREKIIILPGNHDVSYIEVINSMVKVNLPDEATKERTVKEFFKPNSNLRWSWKELCFYKIIDNEKYLNRFKHFSDMYRSFYQQKRIFSLAPEKQFDVFDFEDLEFSIVTLNSCFNNDPLRRVGAFHPGTITQACRALRNPKRNGWITGAAWHHNIGGGPTQDDYIDNEIVQHLIDAGASIAFHGHQHSSSCFDERYRLGTQSRKITMISASTLCSDPMNLPSGVRRGYNVVELNSHPMTGRVHQRRMVNETFTLPIWGPGQFIHNNLSYHEFEICPPILLRQANLNSQISLEKAEKLIGECKWLEAIEILRTLKMDEIGRVLLCKALDELDDSFVTVNELWPPSTSAEIVFLGGAILDLDDKNKALAFLQIELISTNKDASVLEIIKRITERYKK